MIFRSSVLFEHLKLTDRLKTYVMFDQVFWRATSGQINRWRRNILGLESTSLDKMAPHKVPFLYNFSPTIVPPPLDWYEWIRVTGQSAFFSYHPTTINVDQCRLLVSGRRRRLYKGEMDSTSRLGQVY